LRQVCFNHIWPYFTSFYLFYSIWLTVHGMPSQKLVWHLLCFVKISLPRWLLQFTFLLYLANPFFICTVCCSIYNTFVLESLPLACWGQSWLCECIYYSSSSV
jgi:hypothetical protein